jgi:dTDP-4-amino-4,6-dideoxygalactose transaminase
MIPRFKPSIGVDELTAAFAVRPDAVARFESAFAARFGASEGIAFAYGRSGVFALCKALGLADSEIVLPAYTCSVVAHAVVLSGNVCRFVDIDLRDYNMDLGQLEVAIGERTRMVIATHVFGFPADVDRIQAIVDRSSQRWGHKIWVVQDCAHSFGARWRGRLVSEAGDAALFGLGISKMMTSIAGGMLTTKDAELANTVRSWRDANYHKPSLARQLGQQIFLTASAAAFSPPFYGFVRWLEDETSLLDSMTKAYHLDGMIRLPPDYAEHMSDVEAEVGLCQLPRYDEFETRRRAHARFYRDHLTPPRDWIMPPDVEGATYSHFPVRVADRDATIEHFLGAGIQLGQLIQYSVPHLSEYGAARPDQFPNSWLCSRHTINLPVHPGLSDADRAHVAEFVNETARAVPARVETPHAL